MMLPKLPHGMKITRHRSASRWLPIDKAFTLVEVMIASGVVGLSFMACCGAIMFDQVAVRKAKERAIAMDFLIHYVENIKALPFTAIVPGVPVNSLYNGAHGAPKILIPSDASWASVNTVDFQTFHPDLLWLSDRSPQMQVVLTQNVVSGILHDIEMSVKISWNPPLKRGAREIEQIDIFRTKDL
jgi:Tfp pilus assembly protein PilV